MQMPSVAYVRIIAMAAGVVALAGCASVTTSALSAVDSGQAPDSRSGKSPQLPKSYPCQNLHVKLPNCPPR
jgi:hypothetical protein